MQIAEAKLALAQRYVNLTFRIIVSNAWNIVNVSPFEDITITLKVKKLLSKHTKVGSLKKHT